MNLPLPAMPHDVAAALAVTGCLPSAKVAGWMAADHIDVRSAMLALLTAAAVRAQPPVSHFRVGAVALGMPPIDGRGPGNLFLGANLEFVGLPLGMSVHAEQSAVNHAWLAGETGLQAMAVTAPPCGHCRQFLRELGTADGLRLFVASQDSVPSTAGTMTLAELLPHPFGPRDLGLPAGLMSPSSRRLLRQGDALTQAAIAAAEQSYAPYSGNAAGVALLLSDGGTVVGRTAENAAYNPSLPPLPSALAALAMGKIPADTVTISRVVLAEVPTRVSQRDATELLLRAIAPHVRLEYFAAVPEPDVRDPSPVAQAPAANR